MDKKKKYTVKEGKKFWLSDSNEKPTRRVGGDSVNLTKAQAFDLRDHVVAEHAKQPEPELELEEKEPEKEEMPKTPPGVKLGGK